MSPVALVCAPHHLPKLPSSRQLSQAREEERLIGEGDINPMSYIKRNTIRVKERWDALK